MKFRKLRIAWSVAWGVAAVLVGGLWVRSYWVAETVSQGHRTATAATVWAIVSNHGGLLMGRVVSPPATRLPLEYTDGWTYRSRRARPDRQSFEWESRGGVIQVRMPMWPMAALFAISAAAPWLRFGLRTLLIVLTLVGVSLGSVTYWLQH